MNFVSDFFLRAKHWQIFLFLVVVCLVGQAAVTNAVLTGAGSLEGLGGARLVELGLVQALFMCGFLSWFWFVGAFLRSLVRLELRPKIAFFRTAIIYPVAYAFAVPALFANTDSKLFAVLLPLHLFAMVCLIYDLHFVAKSLALAVTGKPKLFPDFAGTFFLLWFFPVGIWSVQPKVNQLYKAQA